MRSPEGIEPRTLYSRAATTIVLVDAATQRPRRINDRERAAWTPYLDEPVQFTSAPEHVVTAAVTARPVIATQETVTVSPATVR